MEVDDAKARWPSIYWIPFVLCIAMLFVVDVFQMQYFNLELTKPMFTNVTFNDRSFTIFTPGCKIPYMDPFDEHIKKYITAPKQPVCNEGKPPLFESNLTAIYVLTSSLSKYNLNDTTKLQCCYSPFWRMEPKNKESDSKFKLSEECRSFEESATINEEFILVKCKLDNTTIYNDTFAFVPLKVNNLAEIDNKRLNVLVIGLDAVSRLNLHRQMPKTVTFLKRIKAVELLGYNKVGDNTFPNLIPMLTGLSEKELTQSCWPKTNYHFDNCTFIWNLYKNEGHLTVFGEDAAWMGLFNYQRKGFKKQNTDYSYSYFNRYSEMKFGNSHNMNAYECEGGRLIYKDLLDYIKTFVITMDKNRLPYFGFFWGASLSHDYLNKPHLGDNDYYLLFKKLLKDNHLENTALFFISDHGIRWGSIRQTFQGRMEERLPFVYAILPKTFQEQYPTAYRNLNVNSKRLTTPFDMHETLLDLLNPPDLLSEDRLLNFNQSKRGISLFNPISVERTCEDAEIASHWCTCQQSTEIEIDNVNVINASKTAILHLNNLLKGYAQCAKLELANIENARLMAHSSHVKGDNMLLDYMLTMKTLPSQAIFEVTVRYAEKLNRFDVIGTISRLNLYGKQSACITDFHLKLYCYCKSLL